MSKRALHLHNVAARRDQSACVEMSQIVQFDPATPASRNVLRHQYQRRPDSVGHRQFRQTATRGGCSGRGFGV
jgi:hypothetical protein